MKTKKCCCCGEEKPLSAFGKAAGEKDGLRHRCKPCFNAYTRAYNAAHPEKVKATNRRTVERLGKGYYRANHQRLKRQVMDAYGGQCECCGETELEFLSLDHNGGGGTKHRKEMGGGSRLWRWLRDNGWPRKYEGGTFRVLCMNCQTATRYGRTCPHQLTKKGPDPCP